MSHECSMIIVSAPHLKTSHEELRVRGLKCGYCQGNGHFWGEDKYGQYIQTPCPICKGSGKVDAEITIDYKPIKQQKDGKDY